MEKYTDHPQPIHVIIGTCFVKLYVVLKLVSPFGDNCLLSPNGDDLQCNKNGSFYHYNTYFHTYNVQKASSS